jgi:hypothetical protein
MTRFLKTILIIVLLAYLLPTGLHAAFWSAAPRERDWRRADWSSSGLLEAPEASRDAVIQIYSARSGRWYGMFAVHTWIVVKPEGAAEYKRFDVIGWGDPVRVNLRPADGRWFGHEPVTVARIVGPEAGRLIPAIEAAVTAYPFTSPGTYRAWPGPNSNTFVASILRAVPELDATLLPNAIGKDFPADGRWFGRVPGGIFLSIGGYAGFRLGWRDGIEINLFGAVAGIDFRHPALKVPGFGRVGL